MSGLVHCMRRSECLKALQRTAELLRTGVYSDDITSDKRSNLREVKFIDALRPRQRPYLKTVRDGRAQDGHLSFHTAPELKKKKKKKLNREPSTNTKLFLLTYKVLWIASDLL